MQLLTNTYDSKQIASALGIEAKDIQNWATRDLIVGHRGPGKGRSREYSWGNLMEIAVAASLMEIGVSSPKVSFEAAQKFSHIGRGPAGWVGEPENKRGQRHPGLPFHHNLGDTYLYVSKDKHVVAIHRVGEDIEDHVRGFLGEPLVGYIAINLSVVFNRVYLGLGHNDPYAFLDSVYPEDAS